MTLHTHTPPPPIVTLLTDFGLSDPFVGSMKGVILGVCPEAHVVDLTHGVPPQQVLPGALALRSVIAAFPAGTVHVAVVDPGVGTARRAVAVATDAGIFVGPDNGLLTLAAPAARRRAVHVLTNEALFRTPVSPTFHGRDVFAPVAAHLARGLAIESVGPETETVLELDVPVARWRGDVLDAVVLYVDHFGNLTTNVAATDIANFPASRLSLSVAGAHIAGMSSTYAAVPEYAALALVNSWGMVEIGVRNGDAARRFGAGPGTPVTIRATAGAA